MGKVRQEGGFIPLPAVPVLARPLLGHRRCPPVRRVPSAPRLSPRLLPMGFIPYPQPRCVGPAAPAGCAPQPAGSPKMPPAATRGQTMPTQPPHPKAGAGGTDLGEPLPPRADPELAQKDGTTGTSLLYRDIAACSVQTSPTVSR